MDKKSKSARQRDFVVSENGDYLSQMPTATCEQLNIVKILQKPVDDCDLKRFVSQLRELTECTEDEAVTALYDCENNLQRAVELLLDKFRCGNDDEWHTTVGKRSKPKHNHNTETVSDILVLDASHVPPDVYCISNETQAACPGNRITPSGVTDSSKIRKEKRNKRSPATNRNGVIDADTAEFNGNRNRQSSTLRSSKVDSGAKNPKANGICNKDEDGWDPYTEYGEWTGEIIEVVNSDVNIAKGLQEEDSVLHSDLLVESDAESARYVSENVTNGDTSNELGPPEDADDDATTLFVKTARSKPPPPAFNKISDIGVFIAPDVLPVIKSRWNYAFGGEWKTPQVALPSSVSSSADMQSCVSNFTVQNDAVSFSPSSKLTCNNTENGKVKPIHVDSSLRHVSEQDVVSSTYVCTDHSTNSAPNKSTQLFHNAQKPRQNQPFVSEASSHPSKVIQSSFKDYMLDGLSNDVSKMSVVDPVETKNGTYVQPPNVSNIQTPNASFVNTQNVSLPSMTNQLSKNVSHGAVHQLPSGVSTNMAQTSQQATTLPPPMTHFVGQFAPPPYHMFNMPGGTGNPPALFDLDQLQIMQQHQRMLYDMHLQHQAATTVQSILTPTSEVPSTSKPPSQSMPVSLGHVTAANAAIRPDMVPSTVGHAPQLMPTGHPYFHYPGFVFMNGYPNAYLNQQVGQDSVGSGASSQLATTTAMHGPLPVTQSNGQNQAYNTMKVTNAYDELLEMKYGDPSKQVGFKSATGQQQPYAAFTNQGIATTETTKQLPQTASNQPGSNGSVTNSVGYPAAGSAVTHFQQQAQQHFYPPVGPSSYFTAAAVAVAAAAAASAQQQQQQQQQQQVVGGGSAGQSTVNSGGPPGPGQMTHLHGGGSGSGGPAMVFPSAASLHMHHASQQRSVIPH